VSRSAEIVAWSCFFVGVALLFAGVAIGLGLTFWRKTQDVKQKVEEAKDQIEELKETAMSGSMKATVDEGAAASAQTKAAEAKSTLEEIGGIVGALPENLRFAGLLVLVGTVLMSVATVQFGGHSLF
jgi:hypothetical protein